MPNSSDKVIKIYEAIGGLKSDIGNINTNINSIKKDVNSIKEDISDIKTNMGKYSERLKSAERRINKIEDSDIEDTIELKINSIRTEVNRIKSKYFYIIGFGAGIGFVVSVILSLIKFFTK